VAAVAERTSILKIVVQVAEEQAGIGLQYLVKVLEAEPLQKQRY
jgi:hypothetical protein